MEVEGMQFRRTAQQRAKPQTLAAAILTTVGSLFEVGIARRVEYDRTPVPKVSLKRSWRTVGDAIQAGIKAADVKKIRRNGRD